MKSVNIQKVKTSSNISYMSNENTVSDILDQISILSSALISWFLFLLNQTNWFCRVIISHSVFALLSQDFIIPSIA